MASRGMTPVWMVWVWLIPVFISLLLLAAHFLRYGNILFMALLLLVIPLLAIRKKWVVLLFRILLFLGAVEWVRTIWTLVAIRMEFEKPYLRMAVILGVVALFTALSAFVFNSKRLRNRFSEPEDNETERV
jgi:hypothetical protein